MRHFVYELIDPRNGETFYVGKGQGNRHMRHSWEAKHGKSGDKCDRIRSIHADGVEYNARIVQRFANADDAYRLEATLIASYGLHNLTNIMPSGLRSKAGKAYAAAMDNVKGLSRSACVKFIRNMKKLIPVAGVYGSVSVLGRWEIPMINFWNILGDIRNAFGDKEFQEMWAVA